MNRYIVVNTKKQGSDVWETIGDNYTPSKGEVCIIVPPTSAIDTTKETTEVSTARTVVYATDDGNGNLTLHTETADASNVSPVSIKIGDGSTIYRNLPLLTSGNVQGDWKAADPTDPSYIHNKPVMNDDLFQQSEEKTLLIPSSSLYDSNNNIVITGLLDLFNITYKDNFDNNTSMILTTAEKQAVIYVVNQGSYTINDLTNANTKVLTASESNRIIVANKIAQLGLNNIISDVELSQNDIDYLKELILKGSTTKTKSANLAEKLNQIVPAEDVRPNVSITVKDLTKVKMFHGEEYIKISDHYFHPNDLLIYNDNNWGYYELHMFGEVVPFYDNEISLINWLSSGALSGTNNNTYTEEVRTLLKQKINTFITNAEIRNFLLNKLNYLIARSDYSSETDEAYNEKIAAIAKELGITDATFAGICFYLNSLTLSDSSKTELNEILKDKSVSALEINKQPRYWFYKSNILKIKEKETLTQMIKDAIYAYNNRFNTKEREILLIIAEGGDLSRDQQQELMDGLREQIINKINVNPDIIVNNGKAYLKERLSGDYETDEEGNPIYKYNLTADEQSQLVKQIQISKNTLSTSLGETEINTISEEVLNALVEQITLGKENTIQEGYDGDVITYYEINNEIILDCNERAIYMRLNSLIGYLKYTKNLEIIFHYKDRSINSAFLSDLTSNWNENDSESSGYIANRIVYKKDNGVINYETWFYEWLYSVIQTAVKNWFDKNVENRLKKIEDRLDDLENKYNELAEIVQRLTEVSGDNITKLFARLNSVIVSQPTVPVLTETFFPKIWICTDSKSGYGLVYWRSGGENALGNYDESLAPNVKWTPISAIWSPDTINN